MKNSSSLIFAVIHIFVAIATVLSEDTNYFEDTVNLGEIVDPNSFFYDRQSKAVIEDKQVNMKSYTTENTINGNENIMQLPKQTDTYRSHELIFYKRLINLLLSNIEIKEQDDVFISGTLEIEATQSQIKILRDFHTHEISLREVDEILSNIIKKPQYSYAAGINYVFDILQKLVDIVLNLVQQYPDACIILIAIVVVCWMLSMLSGGKRFPVLTFIQIIFVIGFFMTWWHLIQEAEIKLAAAQMKFSSIPISCQPDKMNTWDKFISLFSNDDCEEYYRAMRSNAKLKVNPALALSHFISVILLHPLTHVATVMANFVDNATYNVFWAYAWIIKCIFYVCFGIVIIVVPLGLFGAHFNLGLGPFFKLGIMFPRNGDKGKSLHSIEKREPIQIILQLPQSTELAQLKDGAENEQSEVQVVKSDHKDKHLSITDCDFQKHDDDDDDDLSHGDTIKNVESSKTDSVTEYKKSDAMKTKKNDGSGDC